MPTVHAQNYINGQWLDCGETFESVNPADTTQVLGVLPQTPADMVGEAVKAARAAYDDWRSLSWVTRAEYIDNLAQLIKRDTDKLTTLVTQECGKPKNEGYADVIEALHMAQYMAGKGREPIGLCISSEIAAKDAYILRKPKGVVGVITPWNFPVAIPLWGCLPALLAGNTVVLKPSEETPVCGHELAKLFEEAGFPAGVINIVHGDGAVTGNAIATNPDVNVMLFTGSRAVGKKLQQAAAMELHKFVATEMGGKNATIILDDANLDIAVNAAVLGAFKTSGQRCVTSGRMIVDKKIEAEFTKRYIEQVKNIVVGDGLKDGVFMGPLINQKGVDKWNHHNKMAQEEGAQVLVHGTELTGPDHANGTFVSPFVYRFDSYKKDTYCLREEAFSPHVAIIPVDGIDEAIEVYNDTDYGLAMAVITENYRNWRYVRDKAEYGLGYVNLPSIGAEVHLPFGGVKSSGNGNPAAEGALDAVTHRVAFTVNHSEKIELAQGLSGDV
jgi:aldehyde dehydrogenase (NAD+)